MIHYLSQAAIRKADPDIFPLPPTFRGREKLCSLLATIPPRMVADFQFSSPRENCSHHRCPAFRRCTRTSPAFLHSTTLASPSSFHSPSRLTFPPFRPFLGNNPSRHSAAPVFFPSINRNSLGDPTGVSIVIRTGISLGC